MYEMYRLIKGTGAVELELFRSQIAETSIASNQNAYNAGMAFKFGKGATKATKESLQKQVKYLNERNAKLEQEVQELKELVKKAIEKQQ